ncbi:ATP12 family chaperone protein [Oceanomicrobium pacificus]|uniref:ATPase n=1 Tax=Oceanomicrobium pacificus TaxID=2692916 RepID=A0A6B0TZH8_9RHOB|nr:ATP12 family protein [Oceanomicrobium pacificus]MXU66413.1 ATPase [Oceanomicrobium pacificus]
MSWAAKKFWTDVSVDAGGSDFGIRLDARPVRTPGKAELRVPSRALAEAIADEWAAVEEKIDPRALPFTRAANSAIDTVTPHFREVADELAAYGGSDLLCYRATDPNGLVVAQAKGWDPLLERAAEAFGARLTVTSGVVPVDQPADALAALRARLDRLDPFELTAVHALVSLSGSLVIGLLVAGGQLDAEEGWDLSRIDEAWQERAWGVDAEAAEAAAVKRADFLRAATLLDLHRRR